jgi:hypothetical protein
MASFFLLRSDLWGNNSLAVRAVPAPSEAAPRWLTAKALVFHGGRDMFGA